MRRPSTGSRLGLGTSVLASSSDPMEVAQGVRVSDSAVPSDVPLEQQLLKKRSRARDVEFGIQWQIDEIRFELEADEIEAQLVEQETMSLNNALHVHDKLLKTAESDAMGVHRAAIALIREKLQPLAQQETVLDWRIFQTRRKIQKLKLELEIEGDTIEACNRALEKGARDGLW